MREVLNAGYKKGGLVSRCADGSRNHDLLEFEVYCPKVVAAIGGLTGALMDRHISIRMKPTRKRLEHSWEPIISQDSAPLLKELRAFKHQYTAKLDEQFRAIPRDSYWVEGEDKQPIFRDREFELFNPLLSVMRLIGSDMEARFIQLALKSSRTKRKNAVNSDPQLSKAMELYGVLTDELIFSTSQGTRIRPSDLIQPLIILEETWAKVLKGDLDSKQSDASTIGKFLNPFHFKSYHRKNTGSTYETQDLKEGLGEHLGDRLQPLPQDSQIIDTKTINAVAEDSKPERSAMQQTLLDQQHTEDVADVAVKQRVQTREQAGGEQGSISAKEKKELEFLKIQRGYDMGKN